MPDYPVTPQKTYALARRMEALGVREQDLKERFIRGSGRGGQKKNKTSSCVYLLHRPSGIEVKCQKDRRQAMNRFFARRELCELLERKDGKRSQDEIKRQKARKNKARRARRRRKVHTEGEPENDVPYVPPPSPLASILPHDLESFRRANAAERRDYDSEETPGE